MSRAIVLALTLAALSAFPAGATDIATEASDHINNEAAYYATFETGTLAALGADTSKVAITLPEAYLYHPGASGVPTWRVILGVRTLTGQADSVFVAMLHGIDASRAGMYRSVGLADTAAATVYPGTPKAYDLTLYPLATLRQLDIYVANIDSTASSFAVDVFVEKGQ